MKVTFACIVLLMFISYPSYALQPKTFSQSLTLLKQRIVSENLSQESVDSVFKNVKRVRRFSRDVPTQTAIIPTSVFGYLDSYLPKAVNDEVVKKARDYFKQHLEFLRALESRYQVQPRFLIAHWGINNKFVETSSGYDALSILSSLHHTNAKKISLNDVTSLVKLSRDKSLGDIDVVSNWQGKLGLLALTPSQVLDGYQDYDGDGRVDLWHSMADALATAAKFLASNGWDSDQTWGRQVKIPADLADDLLNDNQYRTLAQWSNLGLIRFDNRALPNAQVKARLLAPDGRKGRVYLTYKNFELLLQLNDSPYDAVAVGYLSNRIKFPAIN